MVEDRPEVGRRQQLTLHRNRTKMRPPTILKIQGMNVTECPGMAKIYKPRNKRTEKTTVSMFISCIAATRVWSVKSLTNMQKSTAAPGHSWT